MDFSENKFGPDKILQISLPSPPNMDSFNQHYQSAISLNE